MTNNTDEYKHNKYKYSVITIYMHEKSTLNRSQNTDDINYYILYTARALNIPAFF